MKDIAIYGAGGLGREIACMIRQINEVKPEWNLIGFFDDGKEIEDEIGSFGKILGGIRELNSWPDELELVLCFGIPETIKLVYNRITNSQISFPNLIHPSFFVADMDTFRIGKGNIITGNCSVTTNFTLGNFNLLNGDISIGHDVIIGDFNTFMPGARISGEVSILNENLIEAESFIKQGLTIGNNVTISPLSALLTKPKNGNIYIGNPAKIFRF